ncbi:hypothetical protein, partial [Bradyrhizobium sp. NBAIM08]|uniref:hypothetical protein n=1 Tax=Bradyrhizobium sp. NBAIM08 TaxID=2793815 RepID=UPI001CD3DD52
MDLPKIGARELTTQPGLAGPYSAQQPLRVDLVTPPESPSAPSHTVADVEPVGSDQVLATPASLWRRTFASI